MSRTTLEDRARTELDAQQRADAAEVDRLARLATFSGEPANVEPPRESLGEKLRQLMTPWSAQELADARKPNPHVFQDFHTGLFPVGEVSVLAAAGREGKTTVIVGISTALIIEHTLGDLTPIAGRSVVIYSCEDNRAQYASKVEAQVSLLGSTQARNVMERLIVPNLDDLESQAARAIVTVMAGQPVESEAVDAIIEALLPMLDADHPPGLVVFETVSTLSDAEEDNKGFRALIMALKRIARALNVAVLLSHHVSQASLASLSELNLSTADIRGGTTLVNNARQALIVANLGSDARPFPASDARAVLRAMVAPDCLDRITVLAPLDGSKGEEPPPVFFRWVKASSGHPAAVEIEAPPQLRRKTWMKVREMLVAERVSQRSEAKSSAQNANVALVIRQVAKLEESGKQPTARAVSIAAGKSATWATGYLQAAVESGELTCAMEPVERTKGGAMVYRMAHSTEMAA
ncbi:MAG: AAA family ATPase [Pseudoxanthomonas sp.]|uniref:AAA family ATPase n=1 Tax=Pseudoxanthomonas sp. TaxID=1871049 RepID=UPI002583A7AB|nr:AAA family ATPase [Pseudoxanthomonas sp.]MCH2090303.1 AAA family ATPase [Pseudoxanthomonas sp.]